MYPNQFDEFQKLLVDLCVSVNRPYNDDFIRVFWDDLRNCPFDGVQRQANLLRSAGKTKFTSNDLRPPAQQGSPIQSEFDNNAIMAKLNDYMLRHYWHLLTDYQMIMPNTFVTSGPRGNQRVIAMKIRSDEDELGNHVSGYLINIEDCINDVFDEPRRAPNQLANKHTGSDAASRAANDFDEADAVREVLDRRY